jgi:hypothetical protein
MWIPDGPLPGLSWRFGDGRVCGGWTGCLRLCLARAPSRACLPSISTGVWCRHRRARLRSSSPGRWLPWCTRRGQSLKPRRTDDAVPRRRILARACCPQASYSSCTVRRHACPEDSRRCRRPDPLLSHIPPPEVPLPEESAAKTSNWAPSIERTASKRRESSRAVGVVGLFNKCQPTHTTATMVPIRRAAPRSIS